MAAAAKELKDTDEKLKKALYKIGEIMYRNVGGPGAEGQAAAGGPAGGGAPGGKKDDGVIDAEFTEESK